MKKITKILSVFMAIVMVFTCVPMTAFAAERDTSSLDAYLSSDNLAVVVDDLLTLIGERKESIVPTLLNLGFAFVEELNKFATDNGVNVSKASTEDLAKQLIAIINRKLKEQDINSQIKNSDLGKIFGSINIDLNSLNGIIETIVNAVDLFRLQTRITWGDLASLNSSPLKVNVNGKKIAVSTKNSSATTVVKAIISFISDDATVNVIKKVIKGNFDLGLMNETIKNSPPDYVDIEASINGSLGKNLATGINEYIYTNLLADENSPAYADSSYKSFKSDELLAAALLKNITGKDAKKSEATKVANMTFYQLVGTYADSVFANLLIEPLNNDLKNSLIELIEENKQLSVLKKVFNLDYKFTEKSFNFSKMAQNGLFESLNDFVCTVAKVMLQPSVYKELGLKTGSNKNITANLTSVFGYILKTLSTINKGKITVEIEEKKYTFDFSGFTASKIKGKSLEDMVVAVVALFYPDAFDTKLPADVTTMEQLLGYSAYAAINKYMVKDKNISFNKDYKNLVVANGKVKDLSKEQWIAVIGEMGMDVAIYWLNKSTDFGMTQKQVDALKAKGWTWEDFLEEIVDWALGYIKGVPAVSDNLDIKRGVSDGYGPWYKINVILNELLPLSFINGCSDETFTFDIYFAVMNKIFPSIFDCDFAEFADIFAKNKNADNPFNQKLIASTIGIIDNLIFSLFDHDCDKTAKFKKEATASQPGAEGNYCTANGHYVDAVVIPVEEIPEEPEYQKGDVNGDDKINASDARLALRISARLEANIDESSTERADIDGNGKVSASDARKILRFSARLDKTLGA